MSLLCKLGDAKKSMCRGLRGSPLPIKSNQIRKRNWPPTKVRADLHVSLARCATEMSHFSPLQGPSEDLCKLEILPTAFLSEPFPTIPSSLCSRRL